MSHTDPWDALQRFNQDLQLENARLRGELGPGSNEALRRENTRLAEENAYFREVLQDIAKIGWGKLQEGQDIGDYWCMATLALRSKAKRALEKYK